MKIAKSYKQFNKILRKYYKRHSKKRRINGRIRYIPTHNIWIAVTLNIDFIKDNIGYLKKTHRCDPTIFDDIINYGGKLVTVPYINNDNYIGILEGIQETNEDLYYIIRRKDGKCSYASCVGGIREITNIDK